MSLLNFGKKKEEKKEAGCTCGCKVLENQAEGIVLDNMESINDGVNSIKVLGTGCKNCHALLTNTKEAVKSMKLDLEVEYVSEMPKIMQYGVMSMPALVVNEKVVAMGKVLKPKEVVSLLEKFSLDEGISQ